MNQETRFGAVHVDANPAAAIDDARAAQLELLDGDELVELSIRPSPWLIAIVSGRFVAVLAVVAAVLVLATGGGSSQVATYTIPIAVLVAVSRAVVASLQWASRVYILTNRRVMRLSGTLSVNVAECQLTRIGRTNLHLSVIQRAFGLGSIHITPAGDDQATIVWEHVSKSGEIYAKLIRAIKRSQSKR